MKTAKRLLAFALAGVMTLTLLTGCSDSSSKAKQVEERDAGQKARGHRTAVPAGLAE